MASKGKRGGGKGGGRHPGNRGVLTHEDRALWHHVTQDVDPLHDPFPRPPADEAPPPPPPVKLRPRAALPIPAAAKAPPPVPDRDRGAPGLDRRTARRIKRGGAAVEARIDLHGMTQKQAHRALDAFIGASQAAGRRCVLVITGKGTRDVDGFREAGVLRRNVPHWLNLPPNRGRVLAFGQAAQRHGGEGALYVMLKKPG